MFKDFYLNIETIGDVKFPTRANDTDAGIDVYAPEDVMIPAQRDVLIPLNLRVDFPDGYAMIFKEKSGVASKKKLSIGACVVDSSYCGIVHAHLFNHSDKAVEFSKGDKLSQFVIVPVWTGQPKQVKEINMNRGTRGEGGFGSTGK